MKILYDHQIFSQQQYGGISRYFFELIRRFDGIENTCDVSTFYSNNAYYNTSFNKELKPFFANSNFRGKGRILKAINQEFSKIKISKESFDVCHPTYYNDYFIKSLKGRPFIVSFYDTIHEKFSDQFKELKQESKIYDHKKRLLEKSSKIIAISETTKKDIIEIFDVESSKIEVVYLGNSLENYEIGNKRIIEEDYILFVGNRGVYKNFLFFVTTIAQLLIENNLKLVCAGGGAFTQEEENLLVQLKVKDLVLLKKITNDSVLVNYYSHALFFCFPSLYEGFGIPVLETFACGCPALLSTGGSLDEIGGDAAMYFDPLNAESLYEATSQLINNESVRKMLKERGHSRLEKFSWDKTFKAHLDVYKSVC